MFPLPTVFRIYRRIFFPIVVVTFLLAGVNLNVGSVWISGRWVVLAIGAIVGLCITFKEGHRSGLFKEGHHRSGLFHVIAAFAILGALVSATVSPYPSVTLLKVLSLLMLFVYCGTGCRLAVVGRENRFFRGLLVGCEIFVVANVALYAVGLEPMGNLNSLGAVMGVACAPVLLWGAMLGGKGFVQYRKWVLYAICIYLTFTSHARAGLVAALVSSGVLCVALRKYKLLIEGSVIIIICLAAVGVFRPEVISSLYTSVIYKGVDGPHDILASRVSPWNTALDDIRQHPWFGTGLGTTATGGNADEQVRTFSSTPNLTTERGSSYLAIISGVGILGAPPFLALLVLLVGKILSTIRWMRMSRNALHPAVPLAMVTLAGIIHAAFEDWMFAPGYYLCVYFWCLAFVLVDAAPEVRIGAAVREQQRAQSIIGRAVASV